MNNDDRLKTLIEAVRGHKMSAAEIEEQRVSFAFGNSSHQNKSTKEEVREAVTGITAPAVDP